MRLMIIRSLLYRNARHYSRIKREVRKILAGREQQQNEIWNADWQSTEARFIDIEENSRAWNSDLRTVTTMMTLVIPPLCLDRRAARIHHRNLRFCSHDLFSFLLPMLYILRSLYHEILQRLNESRDCRICIWCCAHHIWESAQLVHRSARVLARWKMRASGRKKSWWEQQAVWNSGNEAKVHGCWRIAKANVSFSRDSCTTKESSALETVWTKNSRDVDSHTRRLSTGFAISRVSSRKTRRDIKTRGSAIDARETVTAAYVIIVTLARVYMPSIVHAISFSLKPSFQMNFSISFGIKWLILVG